MSPSSVRLRRTRAVRRSLLAVATAAASLLVLGPTDAVTATTSDFATPIFSTDARGDITTIGNVSTTCDSTYQNEQWSGEESARACIGSVAGGNGLTRFDGAPMPPINNRLSMIDVDVDGDPTTFNSSTARLRVPDGATVLWAGLHWNAAVAVPSVPALYGSDHQVAPRNVGDRFRVRLSTPTSGGYVSLDASSADGVTTDRWDDVNPGGTVSYAGYVDVTDHVAAGGSGNYGVANVQSCRGFGGCFASWSLTVAFAHPDEPARNLNVWHGWKLTTPTVDGGAQEFSVEGITPPPEGPVQARIGVVQADGDRGLGPDSLDISSPSNPRWTTFRTIDRPFSPGDDDWFNSTVNAYGQRRPDTDASPNLLTNLHHDIALVEDDTVISNTDTSFRFRVQTAGTESLYSQVVHSAVDLYEPEIAIAKVVEPAGPVAPGDEVTWTLEITNAGIDPIRRAVVTDPLPDGLTYVAGSIAYVSGGPDPILGTKTDAAGDDEADYDPETRTLTFRVGAGATEADGGIMDLPGALDGSDRIVVTFRTTVDLDPDAQVDNVALATGEGRSLQDPFGPITTSAEDAAPIATAAPTVEPQADLGIAKTDHDAVIRELGDRYRYSLTVENAGPDDATGVEVIDELDPRLRFVGSDAGCEAEGQAVTCPIGDLAVGASVSVAFEVEVVELPGSGQEIPNVATVRGDLPDPDCVPPTPDARCNRDDERTPQVDPDPTPTTTEAPAPTSEVPSPEPPMPAPPAPSPPVGPIDPPPSAPAPASPPPARVGILPRTGSSVLRTIAAGAFAIAMGAWLLELRERRRLPAT